MSLARGGILARLVLVAGMLPVAETSAQQSGPQLDIDPVEIDFGRLAAGATREQRITLRNRGDAELRLRRLGVNCGCASLKVLHDGKELPLEKKNSGALDLVLAPGAEATIDLGIDTTNWPAGEARKRLLIFHGAPGSPSSVWFRFDVLDREGEVVPTPAPETPSLLHLDPPVHQIGKVMVGKFVELNTVLRNDSERPLHLQSLRGQCTCMRFALVLADGTELPSEELSKRDEAFDIHRFAPGEEAVLKVELETGDLLDTPIGSPMNKQVRLFTDDPQRPFVELGVEGELVPSFELEPAMARFTEVRRGEDRWLKVKVRPGRMTDFELGEVESNKPQWVQASLEPTEGRSDEWTLTVALNPATPVGRLQALVRVAVEHPEIKTLVVPVIADVKAAVEFRTEPEGSLRLDFGRTAPGEDKSAVIEIENLEPRIPYVPREVQIECRQGAEHFRSEIQPGEDGVSYRIVVTVKGSIDTRFFSGRVLVLSDHPDLPVQAIPFRGWKNAR